MPKSIRRSLAVLLCLLILSSSKKAHADSLHTAVVEVVVGIVAATAVLTVGVVLLVKHHPALKGCAADGPGGLQLKDAEGQTFQLVGDVSSIKPGDRVRLTGKRGKVSAGQRHFIVEGVNDYGPCSAATQP